VAITLLKHSSFTLLLAATVFRYAESNCCHYTKLHAIWLLVGREWHYWWRWCANKHRSCFCDSVRRFYTGTCTVWCLYQLGLAVAAAAAAAAKTWCGRDEVANLMMDDWRTMATWKRTHHTSAASISDDDDDTNLCNHDGERGCPTRHPESHTSPWRSVARP